MRASKTSSNTRAKSSALMAELGSHKRIDSLNNNTCSFSLVLDERLQLEKTPVAYPIIHSLASAGFSYAFQFFQHDTSSVGIFDDMLAHTMVHISHKPFFSTANFSQQSFSGTSAFGLQFASQKLETSFNLFDFRRVEKSAIASDGKIVYSEVNANNILRTNAGVDLFGNAKQEEHSAFIVHSQKTFANPPIRKKILLITSRNFERHFNSTFDGGQAQNIIFKGSRAWEIVFHTASLDNRLAFGFLDQSTRLFDTRNDKLGMQSQLSQISVHERLQSDMIIDSFLPSNINAILQTSSVCLDGLYEFRTSSNLDFYGSICSHNTNEVREVYKLNGGDEWQFIPRLKSWASLPHDS